MPLLSGFARTRNASAISGPEAVVPLRARWLVHCANSACGTAGVAAWHRRGMVFEGGWCCSGSCLRAVVAAAVARELDAAARATERYAHRIPLGLAMLEQGWIGEADLRTALAAQRAAGGGRLGMWLVRQRKVTEEQVTRALGMQWGCPVLSIEPHQPEGLASLLPRLFVDAFGAIPVRVAAARILYLGFEDHLDPALALALERMTGLRVECGIVSETLFFAAQRRLLAAAFPAAQLVEAANHAALAVALARSLEKEQGIDARLVRVHDCFWLRMVRRSAVGPVPEPGAVADVIGSVRCA